ncbi:MAG: hypothetical protein Q9162_000054 [Coniocarpon cinnabarinum]
MAHTESPRISNTGHSSEPSSKEYSSEASSEEHSPDPGNLNDPMAYDRYLLNQLKHFIQAENASATFACAGNVSFDLEAAPFDTLIPHARALTRPVTLRWDSLQSTTTPKMEFGTREANGESLKHLLDDCQVAGFGFNGKDVVDENYRKAHKMNAAQFCTDFSPYEIGICDAIAQVLMPSVVGADKVRGVRAELYSLNVYSAPSGKFDAHVDTPRSPSQFGSLVVCLPYAHEGGQLLVKHAGQTMEFDWSDNATADQHPLIKWAAFYSDCEHEVREVTSGHRITLTYNLHFAEGSGMLAGLGAINSMSLPLYGYFQAMLKNQRFMEQGGILGIRVDMATYEAMRAIGLETRLRPVLDGNIGRLPIKFLQEEDPEFDEERYDYECDHYSGDFEAQPGRATLVGNDMHSFREGGEARDDDNIGPFDVIDDGWPSEIEKITWIANKHKHEDAAFAYLAYGNESWLSTMYSFAALLVKVPPSSMRKIDEHAPEKGVEATQK